MTFNIMILSITNIIYDTELTTFNIMTLGIRMIKCETSIKTFNIMALSFTIKKCDTEHNDIQQNDTQHHNFKMRH